MKKSIEDALRREVDGEVHFDGIHRTVYSVDASIYEIEPVGIVVPRTTEALIRAVQIAKDYHLPIIPRGAATGIAGGCIGKGLIVDTSKYLHRILQVDYDNQFVVCEPGVVQDQLNIELAKNGFRLGPDTSTGNRATLGGMLANNSAGAHSLLYGCMADHVLGTNLLLSSGELLHLEPVTEQQWKEKSNLQNREGAIYRELLRIRKEYGQEIIERFPNIPRRVSGYNLNSLLEREPFNICKLIAGSEGSLGIATQIKLKISRKLQHTGLCIIYFQNMFEAFNSINTILQYNPIALEMIDEQIIASGMKSPSMKKRLDWLKGIPQALFLVEFESDSASNLKNIITQFADDVMQKGIGFSHNIITDEQTMSSVWELRKSGLGLLLSKRSYSRAIGFLEDISVDPKNLAIFMEKFCKLISSKGKTAGVYGHAGAGCMHVRPYVNLHSREDLHLMKQMMLEVSDLLLKYNGVLSGEHGDGLVRSWLNKKMFGDRLYQAFLDLKNCFDPINLMNPGKVVNGPPLEENLRVDPTTPIVELKTFLNFSQEGGIALAADLCNGNGLCRKPEKTMCPSFQATRDEFDTTRARAQALRSIINGRKPVSEFASQDLYDVMDLCLQCKGCKTECPSEVDMAKMKSEFLHHYIQKNGSTLRNQLFANIGNIYSLLPSFFYSYPESKFGKQLRKWIGITTERPLPTIAKQTFSKIVRTQQVSGRKEVVLFIDTFTEFNEPEIGISAVQVLESLGYNVLIPPWTCCGRPAFSKGYLSKAKKMALNLIGRLLPYAEKNIPIIGLEPSCLLSIKDDFHGLLGYQNKSLEKVVQVATTFDEFIAQHAKELKEIISTQKIDLHIHGHCHQKALVGMKPTLEIFRGIPNISVKEIPSGCCGMAGSFGYEAEHYEISMKIGDLKLFPAIHKMNQASILIANGFSCRSQIEHGTQRKALHLAQFLKRTKDLKDQKRLLQN